MAYFMQHKKIYLTSAQTELKQDNGCCVKFWLQKRAEQNISALPNICPAPLINQIAGCRLVRRAERAESG